MERGTWWATVHRVTESYMTEQLTPKQEMVRVNIDLLGISDLNGLEWVNLFQMTIVSIQQASWVAQLVMNLPVMQKTLVRFLGQEDPLETEMATHSSILAWEIPWREEPGGLQSKVSQSRARLSN